MAVALIMLNVVCTYISNMGGKSNSCQIQLEIPVISKDFLQNMTVYVEFRYSEKATKFGDFFSNLVAFSEYLNFKKIGIKYE